MTCWRSAPLRRPRAYGEPAARFLHFIASGAPMALANAPLFLRTCFTLIEHQCSVVGALADRTRLVCCAGGKTALPCLILERGSRATLGAHLPPPSPLSPPQRQAAEPGPPTSSSTASAWPRTTSAASPSRGTSTSAIATQAASGGGWSAQIWGKFGPNSAKVGLDDQIEEYWSYTLDRQNSGRARPRPPHRFSLPCLVRPLASNLPHASSARRHLGGRRRSLRVLRGHWSFFGAPGGSRRFLWVLGGPQGAVDVLGHPWTSLNIHGGPRQPLEAAESLHCWKPLELEVAVGSWKSLDVA